MRRVGKELEELSTIDLTLRENLTAGIMEVEMKG